MNEREKAIEALDQQYQCYGEGSTLEAILIHEGDDAIIEIKAIDLFNAIKYLKEPTLDDAIKCVEKVVKNQLRRVDASKYAYEVNEILSALKGLKEGKE